MAVSLEIIKVLLLLGVPLLFLVEHLCVAYRAQSKPTRFPPGPRRKPIFGSILDFPSQAGWIKLTELKAQYGDLVYFSGLGQNVLVLNSTDVINDLLEKRSHIYCHRPEFTFACTLMGADRLLPMMRYGEEWRAHRKLAHTVLSRSQIQKYHALQEDFAALLCAMLMENPRDFFQHVRLISGRIVVAVTYGLSRDETEMEYVTAADEVMEILHKATIPGSYLCDLIPFLQYAPSWVPFKSEAKKGRDLLDRLAKEPYEYVKQSVEDGTATPSLVRDLIAAGLGDSPEQENHIMWTAYAMYGAGSETTCAIILTGILAMVLNPEKQRKAQDEIDAVITSGALPTIQDRARLPYVDALIKEILRWHPSVPFGVPRRSAVDDTYGGYLIPESTIVVTNIWAIAHAPNEKYDPDSFIPERFLDESQNLVDPAEWSFGFARRICPGKALGENSIFILMAMLLSVFDIVPPVQGRIDLEFTTGAASSPKPFQCQFKPRTGSRVSLVELKTLGRVFNMKSNTG